MRQLIVIVLACLGLEGCAITPADFLTEQSNVTRYESAQSPRAAVNCMARNWLHAGKGFVPVIVDAPGGAVEMGMLFASQGTLVLFVEAKPSPSGSHVILRNNFVGFARPGAEESLLKGC